MTCTRNFACWPRTWIRNFGSATVGYWSSKVCVHQPKLTQCIPMQFWYFDGLICICSYALLNWYSQILPGFSKLYAFMQGFNRPDGSETVPIPLLTLARMEAVWAATSMFLWLGTTYSASLAEPAARCASLRRENIDHYISSCDFYSLLPCF